LHTELQALQRQRAFWGLRELRGPEQNRQKAFRRRTAAGGRRRKTDGAAFMNGTNANCVNTADLREIYGRLGDDVSKNIFKRRLLYSMLGDRNEITRMLCDLIPAYPKLHDPGLKVCLYGAGGGATHLFKEITGDIPFVIDNYKKGTRNGCPIIAFEEFLRLPDCKDYLIIVTTGKAGVKDEMTADLKKHGLNYILAYFDLPYFDLPYFDLRDEYFVDAGALNGETTKAFFSICPNGHSYLFEPNPEQYEIAKKNLKDCENAEFYPYGLWSENAALRFSTSDDDRGSAKISKNGNIEIRVRRLDDMLKGKRVTFIKMDIEGAEMEALKGAERIIREQKPKLAICVYHKPEDIWQIPRRILDFCPEYTFYLRHYSIFTTETVLYGLVAGETP
jgi:FkbM family methyltransferase